MIASSLLNPMRDALRKLSDRTFKDSKRSHDLKVKKIRADDYHTSQPLFDRGAASRRGWDSSFIRHDSLDEMTLLLK